MGRGNKGSGILNRPDLCINDPGTLGRFSPLWPGLTHALDLCDVFAMQVRSLRVGNAQ